ncbi:hypothetical protein KNU91_gp094 [Enterococcus phage nattely]|uniref:Uncharacterized protein n=1 Tax=Enterococcus phage nattely TaxID=2719593 RepID=A0A6G9LMP4_9CAUD|nr:hypothetical protein KNU91_gp094 [Enterococcus phage nattely]QIQ66261.1 hypothetical protein nattely_94 [Enterococcus phage nattely]
MIETTLFMTGKENEEQLADFNKKRALALNLMGYVIIKTPEFNKMLIRKGLELTSDKMIEFINEYKLDLIEVA